MRQRGAQALVVGTLLSAWVAGCGGGLEGVSARAIGGTCRARDVYVHEHADGDWTATCHGERFSCRRRGRSVACEPERPPPATAAAAPTGFERSTEDGAVTVRVTMRAGETFEVRLAGSPSRDPRLVVWTLHALRPIADFETCPVGVMVDGVVTRWAAARTERRELHIALTIDDVRALVAAQSIDGRVCTEPWSIEPAQLALLARFVAAFDDELRWAGASPGAPASP